MRDPERRMWFRLARQLGCSVRECMARVDSREFSEWMVFDGLDPGLDHRMDYLTAHVIGSVAGEKGKKLGDYMLHFGPRGKHPGSQSPEQMAMILKGLAGNMKRGKRKSGDAPQRHGEHGGGKWNSQAAQSAAPPKQKQNHGRDARAPEDGRTECGPTKD